MKLTPLTIQGTSQLFHKVGRYHVETSPLICCANQWTGFYMIGTFDMKKLKAKSEEFWQRVKHFSGAFGTKYSKMDQVKFAEDSL